MGLEELIMKGYSLGIIDKLVNFITLRSPSRVIFSSQILNSAKSVAEFFPNIQ